MMTHGAMLWGAALYNNGAINRKPAVYGEVYAPDGQPAHGPAVPADPLPTVGQYATGGMLPALFPLPRWEITQPGNVLRVFERGGEFRPIIGDPEPLEDPGRPDVKLSVRGFGTDLRTDPVFIGLQKTRLLDPTLNFAGHQRPPRRLPRQRVHRLPRRLRQRPQPRPQRAIWAELRQPRPELQHRPDA